MKPMSNYYWLCLQCVSDGWYYCGNNCLPFCIRPFVSALKTSVCTSQQRAELKLAQTPPLGSCERERNMHAGLTKTFSLVVKVG